MIISNLVTYRSSLQNCLEYLSVRDKKLIFAITLTQIFLSIVDLIGLAFIGLLAAVSASGITDQDPRGKALTVLEFLNMQNLDLRVKILIFASTALTFFTIKSLFSIYLNRKIIYFMGRKSSEISSQLLLKVIGQPLQNLQKYSIQETIYITTSGVSKLFTGVIANSISLFVDLFMIALMLAAIIFVDPIIGVTSLILFVSIGASLHFTFRIKAKNLGILDAEKSIRLNQMTNELLSAYRELVVKNRRFYYANLIGQEKINLSDIGSRLTFMPFIGKYVMEIGLVFGVFIVALIQFASQDLVRGLSILTLFLAASTRIAPAILRVQQNLLTLRSNFGGARLTLDLIGLVSNVENLTSRGDDIQISHIGFKPTIKVSQVSLKYPTRNFPALNAANFTIDSGEFVAIIGSSGAGKSTLVDLILGVLMPDSGSILIGGMHPLEAVTQWPGAISYVPQDSFIIQGTIRQNIIMGYPAESCSEKIIWEALEMAQLSDFVKTLPLGLDNLVGDRGAFMSGGQRQRLGIARSLLTKPKLLILDESTSSLDLITEYEIIKSIKELKGNMTIVMIAHRLSTIKEADKIIYLDQGSIKHVGKFNEVRMNVPQFEEQLKILEK